MFTQKKKKRTGKRERTINCMRDAEAENVKQRKKEEKRVEFTYRRQEGEKKIIKWRLASQHRVYVMEKERKNAKR